MAAKNRNPWYRGFVGDEERIFRRVGCAAEGLWSKLRRISHDAELPGFLVDHTLRAIEAEDLADLVHLRPGEFRASMRELRERQIIQSAGEFRAGLAEVARGNKRAAAMLAVFDNLVAPIAAEAALEVLLIPPMVTQHLETTVGRRNGLTGRAKVLAFAAGGGDAGFELSDEQGSVDPLYRPPLQTPSPEGTYGGGLQTQMSDVRCQKKQERKKAPAGAREAAGGSRGPEGEGAPWSWDKHLWVCDQVTKLDADLRKTHPEALEDPALYASHFFGRFQFEHEVFLRAQEFYQAGPEPAPIGAGSAAL